MPVSKEVHLVARPVGEPRPEDFSVVETTVADPAPGQILVRNDWMSVDPYMRGRMNDVKSYVPPFKLGEVMEGGAVGTVVASESPEVPVGASVLHFQGWRQYALMDAERAKVVDTDAAPAQAYLGALGMVGLTAYAGLTAVAGLKEGDVVFVSGAAGAVGSLAGQIAKQLGASKVVGSAGGPEKKRRLVEEFGYDAAIDYREGDLEGQLAEAAPEGIDVYFDNVGGDHLRAAIQGMRVHGRAALCGAISSYNDTEPAPGPDNLGLLVGKRVKLQGFLVGDHGDLAPEYQKNAARWLAEGSLRTEETVVEGIDNAVDAFLGMMRGANTGKMLVRLPA
ncbi:NADP-dependent oxidoreductase [Nocardiopsis terrae]|uniref:NADPH-dependent curcumin reductase CurA n=1 Tax=Nocardiopsis terrae TaxID=372655 RepID=A0ABR9HCS9_9ACTN|nr:NADP-dependent oxidoreductase [Nocardiopsis terrae]MBE1456828.1 NADPH-dependent curcumin reductase CurA [Nocardiopsis terrae]GHC74904.1 NADP-dependent oxidoreductase [Nocardiopsis terrae]